LRPDISMIVIAGPAPKVVGPETALRCVEI
jgi:hypothetical protein